MARPLQATLSHARRCFPKRRTAELQKKSVQSIEASAPAIHISRHGHAPGWRGGPYR